MADSMAVMMDVLAADLMAGLMVYCMVDSRVVMTVASMVKIAAVEMAEMKA